MVLPSRRFLPLRLVVCYALLGLCAGLRLKPRMAAGNAAGSRRQLVATAFAACLSTGVAPAFADLDVDFGAELSKMKDEESASSGAPRVSPDRSGPDLKVPKIDAPQISLPDVKVPELKAPDFKAPDFKVPDFKAPDIKVPDFKAPDLNLPELKKPNIELPDVNVPKLPSLEVPKLGLPSLGGGGGGEFGSEDAEGFEYVKSPLEEKVEAFLGGSIKSIATATGVGFGVGGLVGGRAGWALRGAFEATGKAANSALSKGGEALKKITGDRGGPRPQQKPKPQPAKAKVQPPAAAKKAPPKAPVAEKPMPSPLKVKLKQQDSAKKASGPGAQ